MSERRNLLQESLAAIERLQARLDASERARHEPVAIIGAGCRYPGGVETPEDLWRLVRDGVDAVSEVPADRWNVDAYYDPDPQAPGKMITRRGGFLAQVDRFDAQFFGISPREASTLDPQQRLLLETATEALESAGLATDRLAGSATGVFVGITTSDYGQLLRIGGPEHSDVYSATGSALNAAAGRVSFTYGFQGPCLSVDTACSSSLVALHLACQSLRAGESDLALAGGVNVILLPDAMVLFSKWGMMAPDGACKTFDAAADGFVRAEGCAMVALKRLADAQAAGDPILAVIRGSAVNSDGRSSGLTVPNGPAQQAVLRRALADAGLQPADIDYVEAHGTGTPLGDPIEIEALGTVMREGRHPDRPLAIGSVKTNLGHTEAASGLAGLLKAVMALRHEAIPPHLHFSTPNPGIPWADLPLSVPTRLTSWPRGDRARRAGVSSFGFSGTNAHVILEEAPVSTEMPSAPAEPCIVVLSARTETALRAVVRRQATYLADHRETPLRDCAATLAAGRAHYERRLAFVADSSATAHATLTRIAEGAWPEDVVRGALRIGERPKIAFLFTGQGAQYAGMGRVLYESEPAFRAALDRCAEILRGHLDRPLLDVLFPAAGADSVIAETAYTQPALFAVEYALAELWRSWGINPSMVAGHSVGEYVAACVSGVFSLDDGLALIAERGRLMQALPTGGGMAALFAGESAVRARLAPFGDRLAIAALNGPEEIVVSGDADALRLLLERCQADGITGRALDVSHAFHSARLDAMLDAFERRAAGVAYAVPRMPLVSNVTGQVFAPGTRPDAAYWRRHARETVRFSACVDALRSAGVNALLEVGPHPTLLGLAGRAAPNAGWTAVASLRRGRDDRREMLASLAALYARGAAVNWGAVVAGRGARIALPTYPFQRERHWVTGADRSRRDSDPSGHPLLGTRQPSPHPGAQFLATVACDRPAFLAEHVVLGHVLLPGTAYIELALAATRSTGGEGPIAIRAFAIESPLRLEPGVDRLLHTEIGTPADGSSTFIVRSASVGGSGDPQWQAHAKGIIQRAGARAPERSATFTVALTRERCDTSIEVAGYYERLQRVGLSYGPTFKGLRALHVGRNEGVGQLDVGAFGESRAWTLHPALLDAAFHVLGGILLSDTSSQDAGVGVYVPVGIDEIFTAGPAPASVWVAARIRPSEGHASVLVSDLRLEDEAGRLIVQITGLRIRRITADSLARALALPAASTQSYAVVWRPAPAPSPMVSPPYGCLLIADAGGTASAIAEVLRTSGAVCTVISAAEVDTPSSLAAHVRASSNPPVSWVIDCVALDAGTPDDPWPSIRSRHEHVLGVAQRLAASGSSAGLCVVTRGSQKIAPADAVDLSQAALLGLVRTIASETGTCAMRLDLDPALPLDARALAHALRSASAGEPEFGIRAAQLLVPRLERTAPVVVRLPAVDAGDAPFRLRADGTYLVTGGLGGLGLATATWLASRGAGDIVLVGRRPPAAEDAPVLERLRESGARVTVASCDVGDREAMGVFWRDVLDSRPPLRGIVHAAGVVSDAAIDRQDTGRFTDVARAKISGAWNLHELSSHAPLDFFVLYSSASALFGSAGQANYAAANCFLDGLAAFRQARGRCATSIAWGAWADVGMATRASEAVRARWSLRGIGLIRPADAFAALERALEASLSYVVVVAMETERAMAQAAPGVRALFGWPGHSGFVPVHAEGSGAGGTDRDDRPTGTRAAALSPARLREAAAEARPELVRRYLRAEAARVLGLAAEGLDPSTPLSSFGFDSLMAVQLKNRIETDLYAVVPMMEFLQGPSVDELSVTLLRTVDMSATDPSVDAAESWEEGSL